MNKDRALEILRLGNQWDNCRDYMRPDEIAFVTTGWKQMPSNTCFYDALVRVAKEQWPFEQTKMTAESAAEFLYRARVHLIETFGDNPESQADRDAINALALTECVCRREAE